MHNTQSIIHDFEWDVLVEKLKIPTSKSSKFVAKCALVLGDGAFFHSDKRLLKDHFKDYLAKHFPYMLYADGSLPDFLPLPDNERLSFVTKNSAFYQSQKVDDSLKKLAHIPFPVIINATSHLQINKAFDTIGIETQANVYNMSAKPEPVKPLQRDVPLLFNLIGTIEDHNSLVLSNANLFQYFDAIFSLY